MSVCAFARGAARRGATRAARSSCESPTAFEVRLNRLGDAHEDRRRATSTARCRCRSGGRPRRAAASPSPDRTRTRLRVAVVPGERGRNDAGGARAASADQPFDDAVDVDRVVDRLANARVGERAARGVDRRCTRARAPASDMSSGLRLSSSSQSRASLAGIWSTSTLPLSNSATAVLGSAMMRARSESAFGRAAAVRSGCRAKSR